MDVDARKHDTPEVLPWIPPGNRVQSSAFHVKPSSIQVLILKEINNSQNLCSFQELITIRQIILNKHFESFLRNCKRLRLANIQVSQKKRSYVFFGYNSTLEMARGCFKKIKKFSLRQTPKFFNLTYQKLTKMGPKMATQPKQS